MEKELVSSVINKLINLKDQIILHEAKYGEILDEKNIFDMGINELDQIGFISDDEERIKKIMLLGGEIDKLLEAINDHEQAIKDSNTSLKNDVLMIKSKIIGLVNLAEDI